MWLHSGPLCFLLYLFCCLIMVETGILNSENFSKTWQVHVRMRHLMSKKYLIFLHCYVLFLLLYTMKAVLYMYYRELLVELLILYTLSYTFMLYAYKFKISRQCLKLWFPCSGYCFWWTSEITKFCRTFDDYVLWLVLTMRYYVVECRVSCICLLDCSWWVYM